MFQFIDGYLWKLRHDNSTHSIILEKMDSSFNVIETHNITNNVALYNVPTNFGVIGNKLYARASTAFNDVAVFNLTSNTYEATITLNTLKNYQYTANTSIMRNYDAKSLFRIGSYSNGSPYIFHVFIFGTMDTMSSFYNAYPYAGDAFKHPDYPILMMMANSGSYLVGYMMPFLATVNNLSTPIIKTSAQTMKVAYELTW